MMYHVCLKGTGVGVGKGIKADPWADIEDEGWGS